MKYIKKFERLMTPIKKGDYIIYDIEQLDLDYARIAPQIDSIAIKAGKPYKVKRIMDLTPMHKIVVTSEKGRECSFNITDPYLHKVPKYKVKVLRDAEKYNL